MAVPLAQGGDWGHYLTQLAGGSEDWRRLCNISNSMASADKLNQFFGGASGCCKDTKVAALFTYRGLLRGLLRDHGIAGRYDWIVFTRSDYNYLCSISNFKLSVDTIYIPLGEQYGGLTDRFAVFPSGMADLVLNTTEDLVRDVEYWMNWTLHDDPMRTHVNIEQVLKQVSLTPLRARLSSFLRDARITAGYAAAAATPATSAATLVLAPPDPALISTFAAVSSSTPNTCPNP